MIQRTAMVLALSWCTIWGWVGWRGYEISHGASQAIDLHTPGATIPPILLEALETGNRYLFDAVVANALLLVGFCALAIARLWIRRGFKPQGQTSET